jgi:hypothetical protein
MVGVRPRTWLATCSSCVSDVAIGVCISVSAALSQLQQSPASLAGSVCIWAAIASLLGA